MFLGIRIFPNQWAIHVSKLFNHHHFRSRHLQHCPSLPILVSENHDPLSQLTFDLARIIPELSLVLSQICHLGLCKFRVSTLQCHKGSALNYSPLQDHRVLASYSPANHLLLLDEPPSRLPLRILNAILRDLQPPPHGVGGSCEGRRPCSAGYGHS